MNKLTALCSFLFLTGFAQIGAAQLRVNKFQSTPVSGNVSPRFINGISFTPEGILQNTESYVSKTIKAEEAPVVAKKSIIESAIEESNSIIEKISGIQFKYAMMLNVDVESLKNLSLFGLIDNWFGTRYKMGGSTKSGIDCSAFTCTLLLVVYGLELPRTARQQYLATSHIAKKELKEGDLVFFNTHGGVSHVGLYLANNYFVHASAGQGVTISSLDDGYYAKRFICGGRPGED